MRHQTRLQFFKGLFDGRGMIWSERTVTTEAAYGTCVGQRMCGDRDDLSGSRLFFLIDWNPCAKAPVSIRQEERLDRRVALGCGSRIRASRVSRSRRRTVD
jgi:hypothetical protein